MLYQHPQPQQPHTKPTKNAWIYMRVSDEDQRSGHSPDFQLKQCQELAAKLGYNVTHVDWEQQTARSERQRKVWQYFKRSMQHHAMDGLIVYSYSRIHRNFMRAVETMAHALRAGVQIHSVSEKDDPENKYTRYATYLQMMFAEMESDTIRQRTIDGTRMRVEKGMPLVGNKPPYGYRWRTAVT